MRSYKDPLMTDLLHTPLHHLDKTRLPVVLLGGLNLVRALGLGGIQAIVATAEPDEPALHSRYCTFGVALPREHDARVDAIATLGERLAALYGRRVPLMYGSDDALELLYANRTRLARFFLFLACESEIAESLIAKDRFQAFAEARGLPMPRLLSWADDGVAPLAGCTREVVVKPRAKRDWHQSVLCQRLFDGEGKAVVFPSGTAARNHPVVGHFHDQLAFQEYIPGDDTALWSYHGFADENHGVIAAFTGRKVRTYPAGMGESAYIELAHDADLHKLGADVAARCQLRGPFKIDFKRDAWDGRWYVLEINARYTLWQYLGAAHGANLMRVAYDYLVTRDRTTFPVPRPSARWIDFSLDRKAARQLIREGSLTRAAWIASLVGSNMLCNVFSWSDPNPFVQWAWQRARGLARRGPVRVLTFLRRPWGSTAS